MADTDKPKEPAKPASATASSKKPAEPAKAAPEEETEEKAAPSQPPPPLVMRALLGFAGLSLLVGFFLPWLRIPPTAEGGEARFQNGLDLLFAHDVQGTPSAVVLVVPILGALLSAASFMGFRYAAQTAIAVAMAILAYGLWVLFSMFVQLTAYGLWTVAGGTFTVLLLGVGTWMLGRRSAASEASDEPAPEPSAAKAKS
jgi:hypothetical protein